jgi:succinate dehydrogenase flavin-adding protein (antitoxin of CptAB toxin-antitoxin module)
VKVLENQVLLEVFCEEDTGVDVSVKRHVKRVLVQNDDSDARRFHTLLQLWQHDLGRLFTAANLQHNCTS